MIREETITIRLVQGLKRADWRIIAFDFPGSGTGIDLHPNNENHKTKGIYRPDLIAYKQGIGIVTENKVEYDDYDICKLIDMRETGNYSAALTRAFNGLRVEQVQFGVVLNEGEKNRQKLALIKDKVDFAIVYDHTIREFINIFGSLY